MKKFFSFYIPTLPKLIAKDNGYIIILVCHVISQDHIIIWSCEFMGRIRSREVIILPRFVAIGIVVVELFLVCYVISKNHVIRWSFDFNGQKQSR